MGSDGAAYAYWGVLARRDALVGVLDELGKIQDFLVKERLMNDEFMHESNRVSVAIEEELIHVEAEIKERQSR